MFFLNATKAYAAFATIGSKGRMQAETMSFLFHEEGITVTKIVYWPIAAAILGKEIETTFHNSSGSFDLV